MVHKPSDPWGLTPGEGQFRDRNDAGRRLAERLAAFKDKKPVVLALPRGGVPVGYEVAAALKAPLGLVFVRKIGAPHQPELALGAVADGGHPTTILNEDTIRALGVPDSYVQEEVRRKLDEIERRRELYLKERPQVEVSGRTAILVDDGIATGATVRAALQSVRKGAPASLVLAVPVAPVEALDPLRAEADEVVCLETPSPFWAISVFYWKFEQLTDGEVVGWLKRAAALHAPEKGESDSTGDVASLRKGMASH